MVQILRHRDQMVLDIRQIKALQSIFSTSKHKNQKIGLPNKPYTRVGGDGKETKLEFRSEYEGEHENKTKVDYAQYPT